MVSLEKEKDNIATERTNATMTEEDFFREANDKNTQRKSGRKRVAKIKNDEPYTRQVYSKAKEIQKHPVLFKNSLSNESDSGISTSSNDLDLTIESDCLQSEASNNNESRLESYSVTLENCFYKKNKELIRCNEEKLVKQKCGEDYPELEENELIHQRELTSESTLKEIDDKVKNLGSNTMSCFKCGSIFETRYAIIFTQRFYCCRECLPEETTRELRLVRNLSSLM